MTQSQDESIRTALRENGRRLRDFIRSRVAEPEDADDIFQDVVLELTSAYRLMQPIEKMAAWLFRVARNKITDRYRRKKRTPRGLLSVSRPIRGRDPVGRRVAEERYGRT